MKKKRGIIILFLILFVLSLNSFLLNNHNNQKSPIKDEINNKNDIVGTKNLNNQYLTSDNIYSGNGAPWNITHYANKTSYSLPIEFTNNSFDNSQGIEMPKNWQDWEAYKMSANINNLYDTRNYCNGTYQFGPDNGYDYPPADDSLNSYISNNPYQNWTFGSYDPDSSNSMSGNYFNNFRGHDCVELSMNGTPSGLRYLYDQGDKCWWESYFYIPRGDLIDSTFYFDVNPYHLANFDSWELNISLNNIKIYSFGAFYLKQRGESVWSNYSIPQSTWLNTSNVFPSGVLDDNRISIKIELVYSSTSASYGSEDGEKIDYQQFFIDNVQLITKAEVYPETLELQMNEKDIDDISWGKGSVIKDGFNLQNYKIFANFSSNQIENLSLFEDNGEMIRYKIEFEADINLFIVQNSPESLYDTIPTAEGTNFIASNDSNYISWNCYSYVNVSSGYAETEMLLNFPKDLNINAIYDASDPLTNISGASFVDHSINGQLTISSINPAGLSNGYWAFNGKSPNYCTQLFLYNNYSASWNYNTTFMSGDYINITAKIDDSLLVKDYIENTYAILRIRFPDGNLWTAEEQIKSPNDEGYVSFEAIRIPDTSGSNYQSGNYEAIVTWNNSYSNYQYNETGIIYMNFSVIHESIFKTINDTYYFDEILEDETLIVKFSFKDLVDEAPITSELVYAKNESGQIQYLSEPSNGNYWLIYDASQAVLGNNSLTIFANHSYYLNQIIIIKIYVVQETTYHIEDDFITDVSYNLNFTVEFNYTISSSGNGISSNPTTDWNPGDYYFIEIPPQGNYILECNTSSYIAGDLILFHIYLSKYTFQSQSIEIRVIIDELESLIEFYVNGSKPPIDKKFTVEVDDYINITANYTSILGNFLYEADVVLVGRGNFTKHPNLNLYNITIFANDLDQGITTLEIRANKTNYVNQIVKFYIEVTERKAFYEIYLNGKNETLNPFISLKIGSYINITVKFHDNKTKSHISNASIYFILDLIDYNLTENPSFQQYSIILDTYILNIGVKTLELNIRKINYQSFNPDILIEVRKLQAKISTDDDEDVYEINAGDDLKITIILKDLDSNLRIEGAIVSYDWKYGDGEFSDKGNGEYEKTLKKIPRGTYTLTITVVESSNIYNFEEYEITIKAVRVEEETLLWQILLIIAIIVGTAFAAYIVYYQRVLKYPKPVRKVRKYRKTLKRKKPPYSGKNILSRDKGFRELFRKETSEISGLLKGKYTTDTVISEGKISKKELKDDIKKDIVKSAIKTQKKTLKGED